MNAELFWQFLRMLVVIRTADFFLSPWADREYTHAFARACGFIAGLDAAGVISADERERMKALLFSANTYSSEPFPNRHNAGPHITLWTLLERAEQVQEVVHVGPVEVPAPTAPRIVYLLCMRGPRSAGGLSGRLQPVHTLHRVPPYTGVHGRWDHESGIRCLEAGLQYLSCGTGIYLREAPARTPPPAVLARCLRQWQADAFRPRARTFRAGGLSHAH